MSDLSQNEISIDGRKLVLISILSGVIWVVIGNLIILFVQESHLAAIFFSGSNVFIQIGIGLASGALIGLTGILMIRLPSFKEILDEYAIIRQIKELSLSPVQIVYVSLIAGISEEILFRGAIQPLIGIWLTSLLFIGIHGYIRVQSTTHVLYSLFTFGLSMVLGLLFIHFGLIAAIAAHFIYDVVVLYGIKRDVESEKISSFHSSDE